MGSSAAASATVVAHRGDSLRYRENTLAAVASAVACGADRVEIDVRTTADGVSVVLHDRTLLRLWGVPRRVEDMTWAEVAEVGYADVRVPRLCDVLAALEGSGVGLLVDSVAEVDAVAAWSTVSAVRSSGGPGASVDVHWCGPPAAMLGVRRADPAGVVHLNSDSGYADASLVSELRPTYLNLEGGLLSPEVVVSAHAAGLLVSAWTIDDAWAMSVLADMGVDSITTNRPALLHSVLASRRAAPPPTPESPLTLGHPPSAGMSLPTEGPPAPSDSATSDPSVGATWRRLAADLAGWAASYIRESTPGYVDTKAHAADVVTDVDRAVERRVREVLATECPTHVVVGEEEGGASVAGIPTWYVDPLDGTTNFAAGLGWCSFSLALAVDRVPVVAAVGDAIRGSVLSARAGHGTTLDGVPVRARVPGPGTGTLSVTGGESGAGSLAGGVVLTEWAAHLPWPGMEVFLRRLGEACVTSRIMGSGTLSVAAVACGRAAGAVIGEFHPEDHLAAVLCVVEAGGVCLDAMGRRTTWPEGPFLVAAPECAAELFTLWMGHPPLP